MPAALGWHRIMALKSKMDMANGLSHGDDRQRMVLSG